MSPDQTTVVNTANVSPDATNSNSTNGTVATTPARTFPGILPDDQRLNKTATISTAKGDIVIQLFGDTAPKTVSNFIALAQSKFYDGLVFHRRDDSIHIIQGGDPNGNGTGGPGYTFEDELNDSYTYTKGMVAMANRGPDTNGSQFFIMIGDFPLQKDYTIFGKVISGQDVADQIQPGDVMKTVTIAAAK